MDGFLCINKPAGMSSSDVVINVRRLTGEKKAGHCGTLDPNACGLTVVALGKALRLIEYMDAAPKLYRCRAVLGLATDTHDVWGTPVRDIRGGFELPSECALEEALSALEGQIEQVPSKYSALRSEGKRLYRLAREGVEVEVKSRLIGVFWTSLIDYDKGKGSFFFDVCCSRGTYVRTLCDSVGELLGCGAAMSFLLRIEACGLSLENAISLEELAEMGRGEIGRALVPCEKAVSSMVRCEISSERGERFLDGLEFSEDQCSFRGGFPIPGCPVAVWHGGRFIGTAAPYLSKGRMLFRPEKVFRP